ncbi:hypothetical protein ACFX2I_037251 [Malus domestica]
MREAGNPVWTKSEPPRFGDWRSATNWESDVVSSLSLVDPAYVITTLENVVTDLADFNWVWIKIMPRKTKDQNVSEPRQWRW